MKPIKFIKAIIFIKRNPLKMGLQKVLNKVKEIIIYYKI